MYTPDSELVNDAFELGVELWKRGQHNKGRYWLQRAAGWGHAGAAEQLEQIHVLDDEMLDVELAAAVDGVYWPRPDNDVDE